MWSKKKEAIHTALWYTRRNENRNGYGDNTQERRYARSPRKIEFCCCLFFFSFVVCFCFTLLSHRIKRYERARELDRPNQTRNGWTTNWWYSCISQPSLAASTLKHIHWLDGCYIRETYISTRIHAHAAAQSRIELCCCCRMCVWHSWHNPMDGCACGCAGCVCVVVVHCMYVIAFGDALIRATRKRSTGMILTRMPGISFGGSVSTAAVVVVIVVFVWQIISDKQLYSHLNSNEFTLLCNNLTVHIIISPIFRYVTRHGGNDDRKLLSLSQFAWQTRILIAFLPDPKNNIFFPTFILFTISMLIWYFECASFSRRRS